MTLLDDHNQIDDAPAKPLPRRRLIRAALVAAVAIGFMVGLVGFVAFLSQLRHGDVTPSTKADGIVVLTGGSSRVADALDLLGNGFGKRLLISGVHPTNGIGNIQRSLPDNDQRLLACCVDLDRSATDTRSNAVETRRWVRKQGFHSLIVVTSNYHMPRALVELSHELPDVELIPFSVIGERWRDEAWWTSGTTLRLLLSEYVKYIAAEARARLANIGIDLMPDTNELPEPAPRKPVS
ncbi:YdcF family protein [Tardiphaga alba]|uniref:YdcF family protein n=1 Tax=Tardiphaga alba TaxID=340268 RepID=A0ABX8A3C9_9BRAD|nr:YdcF family protein [Tardiphaga alba]QUS38114.1 YdcF family protein [Tardiphaga alba]